MFAFMGPHIYSVKSETKLFLFASVTLDHTLLFASSEMCRCSGSQYLVFKRRPRYFKPFSTFVLRLKTVLGTFMNERWFFNA